MKKCFLCGLEDSIIDFNNESFKNCFLKLLFRREKNFMHGEVRLSLDSMNNVGYHSTCYTKVTVLSKKYNDEYTQFCKNQDVPTFLITPKQEISPSSSQDSVPCDASSSEVDFDSTSMTPDQTALNDLVMLGGTTSSRRSCTTTKKKVVCLFCNISQKKIGQRRAHVIFPKSETTVTQLKKIASTLDDSEVLDKLENEIVAYHPTCFSSYQMRMKRQAEEHVDTDWHKDREIHKLAFNSLATFIKQEIINNHKIMYVTQLLSRYKALLLEFAEGKKHPEDFALYRSEHLEKKIYKFFGDRLTIKTSTGPYNKKIIYLSDMDISTLASQTVKLEEKEESKFQEVAYNLRYSVKNMPSQKLQSPSTVDNGLKGKSDIPEQLYEFMHHLIVGPDTSSDDSNQISVKIKSLCSDIIYMVTKGPNFQK